MRAKKDLDKLETGQLVTRLTNDVSQVQDALLTLLRMLIRAPLLLVGSLYSRNFLSPEYLLQQLKVASFLGVIATGMMLVILIGQIDLSVPWVVTMLRSSVSRRATSR